MDNSQQAAQLHLVDGSENACIIRACRSIRTTPRPAQECKSRQYIPLYTVGSVVSGSCQYPFPAPGSTHVSQPLTVTHTGVLWATCICTYRFRVFFFVSNP